MFQKSISGWTDAEVASARGFEEWRVQCVTITYLSAIVTIFTGHFHNSGRHTVALDAVMFYFELFPILAGFRGDLVSNRFLIWLIISAEIN